MFNYFFFATLGSKKLKLVSVYKLKWKYFQGLNANAKYLWLLSFLLNRLITSFLFPYKVS